MIATGDLRSPVGLAMTRPASYTLAVPTPAAPAMPPVTAPNSASSSDSATDRRPDRFEARWLATPLRLGLLQVVAALFTVVPLLLIPVSHGNAGMMNIVESVGALDRVALWQSAVGQVFGAPAFAGWSGMRPAAVFTSFSLGLLALFVLHGLAFRRAWHGPVAPIWRWLAGPLATHIVMLALVPSNADVFYYEMSGDIANRGLNPYLHVLAEFPANPLLPYNHWVDMATVYGPVWTRVNQSVMWLTGPDPVTATIVYKALLGSIALALACLVYGVAKRVSGSPSRATAAFVLVAWQPNMILESSGQAHSDLAMLLLSTLGIAIVLWGGEAGLRGAIVLVTVSAMIKYVTLPLVGMLGLLRLFGRQPVSKLLRSWMLDGVVIAAVIVGSFLPYWGGPETFREMLSEPGRLFSHPLWHLLSIPVKGAFSADVNGVFEAVIRSSMQVVTLAGLAYALWLVVDQARKSAGTGEAARFRSMTCSILLSWSIILAVLAFVPVNSHAWYWTWPVVPISLLISVPAGSGRRTSGRAGTALPRWFWPYMALTAALTLVYHARIVRL